MKIHFGRTPLLSTLAAALFSFALPASQLTAAPAPTREEVIAATMTSYTGPSVHGVDTTTLTGKVMCG